MSRARYIILPDSMVEDGEDNRVWFDTQLDGEKAQLAHLELLALVEDEDIDELLDGHVTQKEVVGRLRDALGQNSIPADIKERRRKWKEARRIAPKCRLCEQTGDSTKHHFVNKWILRELSDYARLWADRNVNTIPVCLKCHRELHERSGPAKSIVEHLTTSEKEFAYRALTAFTEQKPKVAWLIALGDDSVYEARLMKDFVIGLFNPTEERIIITPAVAREENAIGVRA